MRCVRDSTVVNLFKAFKVAMSIQRGCDIILTTDDNFPADLYIAQGISKVKYIKADLAPKVHPDRSRDTRNQCALLLIKRQHLIQGVPPVLECSDYFGRTQPEFYPLRRNVA